MLPWQRRARDHRRQLQVKALVGAVAVYAVVFFLLLFSARSPDQMIRLKVYRGGAGGASPVLFMGNPQAGKQSGKLVPQSTQKKVVQPVQKKMPVKKPAKKNEKPTPKKPLEPKSQNEQKIQDKKKPVVKEPPKKVESTKIEKEKKLEEKKVIPKKVAAGELKKTEPVKQEVVPESAKQQLPEGLGQKTPPESGQALYVGQSYDQESKAHMALSRSLARTWKPPHGLSETLLSQLSVEIGSDGLVKEVVVDKKSGVLAHDLSAKAALWRVSYPREFWGKTVSIVFGPEKSL
jgi:hypothetical protein